MRLSLAEVGITEEQPAHSVSPNPATTVLVQVRAHTEASNTIQKSTKKYRLVPEATT